MPKKSLKLIPSKSTKTNSKRAVNSFKIEKSKHHVSPSTSEFSQNLKKSQEIAFKINSTKKKKRKRTHSEHSIPNSLNKPKKKKDTWAKKYSRLNFDDSATESGSDDISAFEEAKIQCESLDSSYMSEDSDIDILDTKVDNLSLQDIFKPACNRNLEGSGLNIPKKHFNVCEDDLEPDLNIYEHQDLTENSFEQNKHINLEEKDSSLEQNTNVVYDETRAEVETGYNKNTEHIETDYYKNVSETIDSNLEYQENFEYESSTDFIVNVTLKNNDILLIVNTFERVYLYGLCAMEVLQGEIEILGGILNQHSGVKKVYSSRGSALLYIQSHSNSQDTNFKNINNFVKEELLFEEDKSISVSNSAAVILCKKINEPYIRFIEKHTPQVLFPTVDNEGPRVVFGPLGSWNYIQTDISWLEVTENVSKNSKIVVCGGKGVGKSTFLRYCINQLLKKYTKIRVVDLDAGQTEFTVPGCISIVKVEDYLLGSNFTHHIPFERAIMCNVNVGYDIHQYLKSVRTLLTFLTPEKDVVTLYNLCGYHKGLGLDMTMKLLNMIDPTKVIQLKSTNQNKNYIFDLTSENVNKNVGKCVRKLNYEFVELKSGADGQKSKTWSMEPRFARELNILAYLGRLMSDDVTDLTSCNVRMYSIKLSSLKIKDYMGKDVSPLCINANFVGLCSFLESKSEFMCHGWGFVRGLDPYTDILVLLTPENLDTLEQVDHLVLTSNSVVPSLLMTAGEVSGHVPYVMEKSCLSNFAQPTRRSYIPAKSNW